MSASLSQFFRQFAQPAFDTVRLNVLELLAVHAFGAAVGTAALVGVVQHVRAIHLVVQRMEPLAWRCLGFGMQRRLQLLKLFWRD